MLWISAIFSIVLAGQARAFEARESCAKPSGNEPYVSQNDFPFSKVYTLESMKEKFEEMYMGPKRLLGRAYFDPQSAEYKIPLFIYGGSEVITLPNPFVLSVIRHIELALERKYADYIFFADMGHSHFAIPMESWESYYKNIPVNEMPRLYQEMMQDSQIRSVYHTAEQLLMNQDNGDVLADKYLQWRYYTRNIISRNDGVFSIFEVLLNPNMNEFNTVKEIPGHQWFGGGFYLHSNKKGCFEYRTPKGQKFNFDISYESFPY